MEDLVILEAEVEYGFSCWIKQSREEKLVIPGPQCKCCLRQLFRFIATHQHDPYNQSSGTQVPCSNNCQAPFGNGVFTLQENKSWIFTT